MLQIVLIQKIVIKRRYIHREDSKKKENSNLNETPRGEGQAPILYIHQKLWCLKDFSNLHCCTFAVMGAKHSGNGLASCSMGKGHAALHET